MADTTRSVSTAGAEAAGRFRMTRLYGLYEVVDLRGIFFAAQIEPYGLGERGRIAGVPALVQTLRRPVRVADIDLHLLPVGDNLAIRAPHRHLGRHFALAFIAPVRGDLARQPVGIEDIGVDFIIHVAGEKLIYQGAADRLRPADQVIHQVNGVARIIIETAASFLAPAAPGRPLDFSTTGPKASARIWCNFPSAREIQEALELLEEPTNR